MKVLTYFDVATQQVTTHPTNVLKVEGFFRGSTSDQWLQLFDSATAPVADTVPLKSWPITQTTEFYKEFKNGELHLSKGLYLGVSTVEGSFTVSGDHVDLSVELDKAEEPSGTTLVGDLTSNVLHLDVWTEAAGASAPKRLVSFEVDHLNASLDNYVMLFGRVFANITAGNKPLTEWKVIHGVAYTIDSGAPFYFGKDGRDVVQQIAGVNYSGCCILMSSTPTVYTAASDVIHIKAEYK
jgi:hypothetical protein